MNFSPPFPLQRNREIPTPMAQAALSWKISRLSAPLVLNTCVVIPTCTSARDDTAAGSLQLFRKETNDIGTACLHCHFDRSKAEEDIANVYIEGTPEVSQIPVNQDKTNAVTKKIQGDRNEESSPQKAGSLLISFSTPKPRNPVTLSPLSLMWKPRKHREPPPLDMTY